MFPRMDFIYKTCRALALVSLLAPLTASAAPKPAPKPAPLTHDEIKAVVDSHLDQVKACLGEHGAATGRLVVEFSIAPTGKVEGPHAKEHSSNAALDACIAKTFAGFTFPKPRGGVTMGVVYPFGFAPAPPPPKVGKIPEPEIVKVLKANQAEIDNCYKQAAAEKPGLKGVVQVGVVIDPKGVVTETSVQSSTLGDAKLDACVAARVKTWAFPKPSDDGEAAILIPFALGNNPGAKPAAPAAPAAAPGAKAAPTAGAKP